jgi:6-pyruvoyltetrahydropterin/6-carboxytetrahydropterin synthase
MFEITVEADFCAAHFLRDYVGKCANLHGHNYRVVAAFEGERLNRAGLLVDFTVVKALLRGIAESLDHKFLNELPPFLEINTSAENIAWYFHQELTRGLEAANLEVPVRVREVRVWETETSSAAYRA